ncbi:MAG: isoprenylcysteine carboxylmethyltransferase family protein [Pseudomonadota bacterium]
MPDRPKILVFPPLAATLCPAAALVLERLVPLGWLPDWVPPFGVLSIGIIAMFGAIIMAASGIKAFKAAGTNVDPRRAALVVVETGPYRITRNPMYLAMVVLQFGLCLTFSLDWLILFAPMLWGVLHFGVVLREEAYLTAKFGAPYQHYMGRTRRWI